MMIKISGILVIAAAVSGCVSSDVVRDALKAEGRTFCQGVCVGEAQAPNPVESQPEPPVEVRLRIEIDQSGRVVDAETEAMGETLGCGKENPELCGGE